MADGTSALAHMHATVADYLQQAARLCRCPLERDAILTNIRPVNLTPPRASRPSPFELMLQYHATTFQDAFAARATARRRTQAPA